MRIQSLGVVLLAGSMLAGCGSVQNMNAGALMDAGGSLMKSATLSDADVVAQANDACMASDRQNRLAPLGSAYQRRLNSVVRPMPASINNRTPNYRVYQTSSINAWAMPNGCIRVYSALMDKMNDDELRGVIGHEIGHVALGHTKARMQVASATLGVRQLGASSGNGMVSGLSQGQAGDLAEKIIGAQFSQSQESEADDYSYDLLKGRGQNTRGLKTAFDKLASLEAAGGAPAGASLFASHPPSAERSAHIQQRIDSGR